MASRSGHSAEISGGGRGPGGDTPMPVGSRLPSLQSHTDAGELRWRDPAGGSTVAVFLQSSDREANRDYLNQLTRAAGDFRLWNGRVIVVMPDQVGAGAEGQSAAGGGAAGPVSPRHRTISVVTEPEGEAEHCGVRGGEDAILIADRWGEVYYGTRGDTPGALPDTAEISEWLQFLATQCPECGVPDEP